MAGPASVIGLPAPGGPGLGASGAAQTNRCCDQFVAREANGYKAEGFSRQRVFMSMNHSEEASLSGTASVPSISRHGSEGHNAFPA